MKSIQNLLYGEIQTLLSKFGDKLFSPYHLPTRQFGDYPMPVLHLLQKRSSQTCLGMHVSKWELLVLLASFLQSFLLHLIQGCFIFRLFITSLQPPMHLENQEEPLWHTPIVIIFPWQLKRKHSTTHHLFSKAMIPFLRNMVVKQETNTRKKYFETETLINLLPHAQLKNFHYCLQDSWYFHNPYTSTK